MSAAVQPIVERQGSTNDVEQGPAPSPTVSTPSEGESADDSSAAPMSAAAQEADSGVSLAEDNQQTPTTPPASNTPIAASPSQPASSLGGQNATTQSTATAGTGSTAQTQTAQNQPNSSGTGSGTTQSQTNSSGAGSDTTNDAGASRGNSGSSVDRLQSGTTSTQNDQQNNAAVAQAAQATATTNTQTSTNIEGNTTANAISANYSRMNDNVWTPQMRDKLRGKKVTIIGCGAVGRLLARSLYPLLSTAEYLELIDHDTVDESNLATQQWSRDDIGSNKVDVLKRELLAFKQPSCSIITRPEKYDPVVHGVNHVIFFCVDDIEVRRDYYDRIKNKFDEENSLELLIDTRAGNFMSQIVAVNKDNNGRTIYPATLFDRSESVAQTCRESQNPAASLNAAGFAISQFQQHFRQAPYVWTDRQLDTAIGIFGMISHAHRNGTGLADERRSQPQQQQPAQRRETIAASRPQQAQSA